jgi:hypothetical protein
VKTSKSIARSCWLQPSLPAMRLGFSPWLEAGQGLVLAPRIESSRVESPRRAAAAAAAAARINPAAHNKAALATLRARVGEARQQVQMLHTGRSACTAPLHTQLMKRMREQCGRQSFASYQGDIVVVESSRSRAIIDNAVSY